jgi:hypothetical protein
LESIMTSAVISAELAADFFTRPDHQDAVDRLRELGGVTEILVGTQGGTRAGSFADFRARTNERFYAGTDIRPPVLAPDQTDSLGAALESAARTGSGVSAWLNETPPRAGDPTPANWAGVAEVDLYGRPGAAPCLANPAYQCWWLGLSEDLLKGYPLSGLYFESDRSGPLSAALGEVDASPACFCSYCRVRAARFGVDVERAKEGYRALDEYARRLRSVVRPGAENPFVVVWRTLLQYPEVLHWQRLWARGRLQFLHELASAAELVSPGSSFGWRLPDDSLSSLLGRAQFGFEDLGRSVDFVAVPIEAVPIEAVPMDAVPAGGTAAGGTAAGGAAAGGTTPGALESELPLLFAGVARPVLADFVAAALGAEQAASGASEYDELAFGLRELARLTDALDDVNVRARVGSLDAATAALAAGRDGLVFTANLAEGASDDELRQVLGVVQPA